MCYRRQISGSLTSHLFLIILLHKHSVIILCIINHLYTFIINSIMQSALNGVCKYARLFFLLLHGFLCSTFLDASAAGYVFWRKHITIKPTKPDDQLLIISHITHSHWPTYTK